MKYRKFHQADDLKRFDRESGHYFFSPDTMRFFRSRLSQNIYHGVEQGSWNVFVTSEQFEDSRGYRAARRYKVRHMTESGNVNTIGAAYDSRYLAHKAAQRYAAIGNS